MQYAVYLRCDAASPWYLVRTFERRWVARAVAEVLSGERGGEVQIVETVAIGEPSPASGLPSLAQTG